MLHNVGLYFTSTGKMTAPTGPRFSRQPRGRRPLHVIWSRPATLEPLGAEPLGRNSGAVGGPAHSPRPCEEAKAAPAALIQHGYKPKQIIYLQTQSDCRPPGWDGFRPGPPGGDLTAKN